MYIDAGETVTSITCHVIMNEILNSFYNPRYTNPHSSVGRAVAL